MQSIDDILVQYEKSVKELETVQDEPAKLAKSITKLLSALKESIQFNKAMIEKFERLKRSALCFVCEKNVSVICSNCTDGVKKPKDGEMDNLKKRLKYFEGLL
jgi:DNA repair exonuclease SbcCD ATPase subunit